MDEHGEIILYQPDEAVRLEVKLENETVWLNRQQLAELFNRDVKTIGKHVNNALKEELAGFPVVAKFATTAADGKVYQTEHYNLDIILSVGYRVKSQRGIEFRRWSSSVLKNYLLKGYAINHRIEKLEKAVAEHSEKIDFFIRTSLPPVEGIFFDGQIFDAYVFVTNLIKSAKKSLILIDNYVDESVLLMLAKRSSGVPASIYTAKISSQLQLDLQRHNSQYPLIYIYAYKNAHDRFLIIDDQVYHIGASLKDLGKKLFAFSKLKIEANLIISVL
nr:RhuM family protein [uncultured Bacteroides sp.]